MVNTYKFDEETLKRFREAMAKETEWFTTREFKSPHLFHAETTVADAFKYHELDKFLSGNEYKYDNYKLENIWRRTSDLVHTPPSESAEMIRRKEERTQFYEDAGAGEF